MNSHLRSTQAFTMSGYAFTATPLMFITPGILKSSYTCNNRQKPTRLPYSCQHQFGMSGIGEPPARGVSTVRGIVCVGSQSSTLVTVHTTIRAPFGSLSGWRLGMGEYAMRSVGSIPTGGFSTFTDVPRFRFCCFEET